MIRAGLVLISVLAVEVFFLGLLAPSISTAKSEQPSFKAWLEVLRKEAFNVGISRETIDTALTGLEPIPQVIELDRSQPEFKLTLSQYLSRMVSEHRVAMGHKKLRENRIILGKINVQYGVQPRFLVALWGIESDFGRHPGRFPVISSLVTLAYDGRRSSYFRRECISALHILDEGYVSLVEMKGSWAGAMGQLQFMPSTFRDFAVDFDGNERIDIWEEKEDIFASAANYLSRCGWRGDQTWGREVRLPNGFDRSLTGLECRKRLSGWQALGVRRANGQDLPMRDLLSSIVQPDGPAGRAFIVYDNYRAILKWNHSHNFAIAVGILSDRIGRR